jgi:hypothetical protein
MNIELAQAITAIFGLLSFVIALINSIAFYRKSYKNIAKKIDGEDYDYGFLFSANRFMLWGQYCIFPNFRTSKETMIVLRNTTPKEKNMLKLHFFMVVLGVISFIASALLAS